MFKKTLIASAIGLMAAPLAVNAALISSAADPALAGSTLINFDAEPTANFATTTILGVTFSTTSGTLRNAPYTEGGVFGGSGQDLSTVDLGSPYSFRIDFASPVSAFGMVWGAADYDWTVRLFNSSGVNTETLTFCGSTVGCAAGTGYEKFYGASGFDIKYVTLEASEQDWVKIDDFQFADAPSTSTLTFSQRGVGHILYVPYFSTQEGNVTALSIVNTDVKNGKVLKVRFRGASNSDDVYDFQVFLSPGDVWTAGVAQGTDGRSRLDTADKSCTLPANVNGAFITSRIPAAGGNAETREGYIEILTMADIVMGDSGSDQRALYTATKHVKAVAPCTTSVLNALTYENAGQYMAAPTTGIMANWSIINVNRIVAYSGAAAAIEARASTDGEPIAGNLVYWDQRSIPLSPAQANGNTADPLLRGATPVIAGARYDLPDLSTPYLPGGTCPFCQARALSDAITVQELAGEFYSEASLGAQTDWVISFPTRRYFAAVRYSGTGAPAIVRNASTDGNIYFTADNTELGSAANGGKPYQICSRFGVNAVAFYDREETPTIIDDIVISPGTPTALSICGEVTVVGVNNTAAADSATFGSVARANVSNGFAAGWGSLSVPSENGLPLLARQFLRINNTQTNVYYGLSFPARIVMPGFPSPFVPAP
jgi:hypothetical protein